MSTVRKLERDFLKADIKAVGSLMARLGEEDVMSRFGLEEKLVELQSSLAQLEEVPPEMAASAALFFGGKPVIGSHGIESEFAGVAVGQFQDLVAKIVANDTGRLAERGTVPRKAASTLHITNIVRGSFGFLLEEIQPQLQIVDSSLKVAVDEATRLLDAFGEDDEEKFRTAVENIDQRVLGTTRDFFDLMRRSGATMRLVAGDADHSFSADAVARAAERAKTTTVEDLDEAVAGQLAGVLPEFHQFEFRVVDERGTIRGKVHRDLSAHQLGLFNKDYVNVNARAHLQIKRVLRNDTIVRESYTLLSIEPETP
ncbi:hypothetical protein [Bradyrhizobium prioriisuperbiae]|uniref:hypothetical protein n=1 Tax=Bradyrhizobium prioriisuperbiae TaxID=2854389 RepID=UPI0028E4791D|nr:hypothetical protein [Bradyrhizobium prioritasuperba]